MSYKPIQEITGGAIVDDTILSADIKDDELVNADINSAAAIAYSKLAALASGNILVGSSGSVCASVNPTGDIDVSNAGLFSIKADSIINADVKTDAAIVASKMASGTWGAGLTIATNTVGVNFFTQETATAGAIIKLLEGSNNGTDGVVFAAPAALTGDRTITIPDADVTLANIAVNTTHKANNGTDHSYIDQSVAQAASPTFAGATLGTLGGVLKASTGVVSGSADMDDMGDGSTNAAVTLTQESAWDTAEGRVDQDVTSGSAPTLDGDNLTLAAKAVEIQRAIDTDVENSDTISFTFGFVPSKIILHFHGTADHDSSFEWGCSWGQTEILITGTDSFTSELAACSLFDAEGTVTNDGSTTSSNTNGIYFQGGYDGADTGTATGAITSWTTSTKTLLVTFTTANLRAVGDAVNVTAVAYK